MTPTTRFAGFSRVPDHSGVALAVHALWAPESLRLLSLTVDDHDGLRRRKGYAAPRMPMRRRIGRVSSRCS